MLLYGIKTCDTCRKALKALPNAELVDIRNAGLPEDLLRRAAETFGSALMNTRSTTWRGLSEEERGRDMLALLRDHPLLMKRPLIEDGAALYLGWGKDVQAALAA
ncbi:arsenate reductase [Pseudooceanicola sp. CBS1P-1]|uniref:Arsenate reductase n=1 Tax=Pseudooceanicola albus TaxID=2692189 RepID=A0A6L7G014_9RHOB|nr:MULTISPECIES: ArsC/Spx/MgsR family protein [Pseudooceanicola]MBT9382731.1 arsenate reductase [Pseudooceanicola endophyticus]MXN17269.1 arsenate reductase [Pseudooceanicola albus]